MSAMKNYLEEVSVSLGFDGEINNEVLRIAEDLKFQELEKEAESVLLALHTQEVTNHFAIA